MYTQTRRSEKRDAIFDTLKNTKNHPSVDWLYRSLKSRYPDLSLGTVYRNLAMFKDDGRIITVGVVNGQERYDADTSDHNHLICKKCGQISDIEAKITVGGIELIEESGCILDSCRIVFHGLCADCAGLDNKTI
ncbi:MAG: transcriptional repressor [Oscillospiraceae bacterium]|jgi:Fur family peroxide stress response transcriptional regulator|nr:transcriptional repressor [Oscillospiraceae bacterium]